MRRRATALIIFAFFAVVINTPRKCKVFFDFDCGFSKLHLQSTSKKKVLDSTPPGVVVEATINLTMPGWCHTNMVFGVLSVELAIQYCGAGYRVLWSWLYCSVELTIL